MPDFQVDFNEREVLQAWVELSPYVDVIKALVLQSPLSLEQQFAVLTLFASDALGTAAAAMQQAHPDELGASELEEVVSVLAEVILGLASKPEGRA